MSDAAAATIAGVLYPADEAALLRPWIEAYAAFHGRGPTLRHQDGRALSLAFGAARDPFGLWRHMIASVTSFSRRPAVTAHFARLGFAWDAGPEGRIEEVPSPATLNRRLATLGGGGFRTQYVRGRRTNLRTETWLDLYTSGAIALGIASPRTWRWRRRLALGSRRVAFAHDLHLLQHDMTVHVLPLHRVPDEAIADLGTRVRRAKSHSRALLPLYLFFENDLPAYCQVVWNNVHTADEFAQVFADPAHYGQLIAALDARAVQTRARRSGAREGEAMFGGRFAIDRGRVLPGRPAELQ